MTKSEFIAQYVLNRALTRKDALDADMAAESAIKAWDNYIQPFEKTPESKGT